MAVRQAEESAVLLKNENSTLPLSGDDMQNVTLLGSRSYATMSEIEMWGMLRKTIAGTQFGGNMGSVAPAELCVSIKDALEERGFTVNEEVAEAYTSYLADTEHQTDIQFSETYSPNESNPEDIGLDSMKDSFGNVAIVTVGRPSSESKYYLPGEEGKADPEEYDEDKDVLGLSRDELATLQYARDNFDKVIVMINAAQMDLPELEEYADSILWVGLPGAYGFEGIARLLDGTISPSGALTDTFAAQASNSIAMVNQQYSLWELTLVDVQAYYESERADADKEALVESLKDYYAKRAALDSTKVTYFDNATFELKEVDKELAVATLDDILEITLGGFDANWNNVSAYSGLLGSDVVINRDGDGRDIVSYGSSLVDATKGSMGAFYDLCYQLWGVNEKGNVIIRYTTLTEEEVYDYMSSVDENDVNDYGPVAYLMYENIREYDRFNNRFVNKASYDEFYQLTDAAYTAYEDKVVQEGEEMDAQKEALQAEKEALQAEIDAIDEKIAEVERLQKQAVEDKKLYSNILEVIAGYYGNALGETQVSYEEALEALKTQIAEKKEEIVTKEQNLAEANAMLEAWNQGLDVEENEELKLKAVKAYIAQVEEEIAGLQLKLDEEQKLFDQYTAEKDALMNVLIGKPYEE